MTQKEGINFAYNCKKPLTLAQAGFRETSPSSCSIWLENSFPRNNKNSFNVLIIYAFVYIDSLHQWQRLPVFTKMFKWTHAHTRAVAAANHITALFVAFDTWWVLGGAIHTHTHPI